MLDQSKISFEQNKKTASWWNRIMLLFVEFSFLILV